MGPLGPFILPHSSAAVESFQPHSPHFYSSSGCIPFRRWLAVELSSMRVGVRGYGGTPLSEMIPSLHDQASRPRRH